MGRAAVVCVEGHVDGEAAARQRVDLAREPVLSSLLRNLAWVTTVEARSADPTATRHLGRGVRIGITYETDPSRAVLDVAAKRTELASLETELERRRARLADPEFARKAAPKIVEGAERLVRELEERRERLLASLSAAGESS